MLLSDIFIDPPKLSVDEYRIALIGKVYFAQQFIKELLPFEQQMLQLPKTQETLEQLLKLDARRESYMMLMVIYLCELIGEGENNKISIYNDPVRKNDKRWREFYGKYRHNIYELKYIRNSLYAHTDVKALNKDWESKPNFWQFIDDAIKFLFDFFSKEYPI